MHIFLGKDLERGAQSTHREGDLVKVVKKHRLGQNYIILCFSGQNHIFLGFLAKSSVKIIDEKLAKIYKREQGPEDHSLSKEHMLLPS